MTVYGYARVSVREPEDKNLDLQVERLVRAGCPMGNIRAEEASGAKDGRGGLLELLDLVVEGDTLVVTHIDRLSRGLTYGLQVIEGLHHPTGGPVGVGWNLQPRHGAWPVGSLTQYRRGQRRDKVLPPVDVGPRGLSGRLGQRANRGWGQDRVRVGGKHVCRPQRPPETQVAAVVGLVAGGRQPAAARHDVRLLRINDPSDPGCPDSTGPGPGKSRRNGSAQLRRMAH